MVSAEHLYMEQMTPVSIERERPLFAYEMTRVHLRNNQAFLDGETELDKDGEPLCISYKSDTQIEALVTQAYGNEPRVTDAIKAAYNQRYKELLERGQ